MSLLQTLLSKRGQFVSVNYEKPVKQLKTSPHKNVVKNVKMVARAGISYDNIQNVKDKRESGELPEENQGLPWGEWIEGGYPYLIKHKDEVYARLSLVQNNIPEVNYFIDGKPCTKEEALQFALASEKPKEGEKPDVININLKNIKELK
jgi:hypothetical protein